MPAVKNPEYTRPTSVPMLEESWLGVLAKFGIVLGLIAALIGVAAPAFLRKYAMHMVYEPGRDGFWVDGLVADTWVWVMIFGGIALAVLSFASCIVMLNIGAKVRK